MLESPVGPQEALVPAEEDVCRLCFASNLNISRDATHPNQVDPETGLIRLHEISYRDLTESGFSLQWLRHYSLQMGVAEAERRLASKVDKGATAYELAGALITKVAAINAIADDDGGQLFRVLDTRTDLFPAHAEVRMAVNYKRADFLKFRVVLQQALGTIRPREDLDLATTD